MKDADNSEPASCVCSVAPGTPHSQSTHHPITAARARAATEEQQKQQLYTLTNNLVQQRRAMPQSLNMYDKKIT